MKQINGKVVYITGGTKGIGKGMAAALLKEGCKIAISGRKLSDVESVVSEFNSKDVLAIKSDVRDYGQEQAAVQKIVDTFGHLDIVIANAGVGIFSSIEEMSLEDWNTMIDTNLTGVFHTLKASVAQLKANKGYYISIASLAGINFFANGTGYNASKFGVVGFTQAAMLDLRNHDVKVTTILPGSVSTNFNNHIPSELDAWKIQPEDMGELVVDILKMNPNVLPSKIEIRPTKTS
ncbi:SDR family oxidoreductase [Myroides sp. LoEW2-1]|uniref:SDR family oxidoreductase n=1 Tax=Myroides sp. LoEW2-1 TaxID=2683192 RepID=UPI00132C462E|nr:SDR family oxidoreductase [Myroides sp. LoEW2-1]MVX37053.1 SDR family oxidoreductase [Myroides sp. LoEW2-1]